MNEKATSHRGVTIIIYQDGRYYTSPYEMGGRFFNSLQGAEQYIDWIMDRD